MLDGVGAGVGGTIGLFGALKRKGQIATYYPGEAMKITTAEPLSLPGFNPALLPSARRHLKIEGLELKVSSISASKNPLGDGKLLTLGVTIVNRTTREFRFRDLSLISDHNQVYPQCKVFTMSKISKTVKPDHSESDRVVFQLDVYSKKHKYWLLIRRESDGEELSRTAIN